MLRPLLLVAALGSAAAQCAGGVTPTPQLCQKMTPAATDGYVESPSDATALSPPSWNCGGGAQPALELSSGLVVPLTIELSNQAKLGSVSVPAKVLNGGTISVYLACTSSSCNSGTAWTTNVLVYANSYTAVAGIDTEFTLDSAGKGTILIKQDILLAADQTLAIGTVWTRTDSFAEVLAASKTSFTAFLKGSEDFAVTNDATNCPEPAFGSGSLGVTGKFLISPPPPPPPPDCCSEANRNCLARCETCESPNPTASDAIGVACSTFCDVSCSSYPTTDSKTCFARCSGCAQGTSTFDAEGQACSACGDCAAYDKCMKAGVCGVGCVAGRRQRKLLFAPLPVCEPCCRPIVA